MCNQLFSTTYEKGDNMDNRLEVIVDNIKKKFELSAEQLATHSIHKERNSKGEVYYKFNMEFFPNSLKDLVDARRNP